MNAAPPEPNRTSPHGFEITRLASASGPLTKRIRLAEDGTLISDGSACVMGRGVAGRLTLSDISAFAAELGKLETNEAIALGALKPDLPDNVEIVTRKRLEQLNGAAPPGLIARIAGNIAYRVNEPALALVDIDIKGMPDAVKERIQTHGSYWAALVHAAPGLADVARVVRTSTSSGITRADTGLPVKGSSGIHIYLLVQDGADIERFLRTLHDRCWLAGLGWMMLGAGGQLLERSLIDRTVYAAERLVFEAAPVLDPPLHQDRAKRAPTIIAGEAADTRLMCASLTILEQGRLATRKAEERLKLSGPVSIARAEFVGVQTARIVERTGCAPSVAKRAAERQCMLLDADLTADEDQVLRELVRTITGVKARPLDTRIKAAPKEQAEQRAEAESDRRTAERADPRPAVVAPLPDAERLPIMRLLDEVLAASAWPVPPIRDLDGHPVEVRNRPPMLLHELTSEGSNQSELKDTRLPAPVLPLLTRHDRYTLSHEIERHIEFTAETDQGVRAVAMPGIFVDHFVAYRDSLLPRAGAIVTAPLVMPDGTLLAPKGLDQGRKLVFQIEPKLMDLMPRADNCTAVAAGKALDYLVSRWLCDVAADFSGKCVLIALALTILERVLLPERPAFFVTAGTRGGGKTTAIMMLIVAVTGKRPAAAAWSPNDEERRKAILAYLAEGLPAMVWDNIPLGTSIACPTLEKALTAESYSDRILGQSTTISVPAFTVMTFTGNNIGPKGDMASRSLVTRLEVDRIDPENRTFAHDDPAAWTLDNRGTILRALYIILLANQQLRPGQQRERKTRFKTWWHLVGSAIEGAAAALVEQQKNAATDEDKYARLTDLRFLRFLRFLLALRAPPVADLVGNPWKSCVSGRRAGQKKPHKPQILGQGLPRALALRRRAGYFAPDGTVLLPSCPFVASSTVMAHAREAGRRERINHLHDQGQIRDRPED